MINMVTKSMTDGKWGVAIAVTIIGVLLGVYLLAQADTWAEFLNRFLAAGIIMVITPVATYFVIRRV